MILALAAIKGGMLVFHLLVSLQYRSLHDFTRQGALLVSPGGWTQNSRAGAQDKKTSVFLECLQSQRTFKMAVSLINHRTNLRKIARIDTLDQELGTIIFSWQRALPSQ